MGPPLRAAVEVADDEVRVPAGEEVVVMAPLQRLPQQRLVAVAEPDEVAVLAAQGAEVAADGELAAVQPLGGQEGRAAGPRTAQPDSRPSTPLCRLTTHTRSLGEPTPHTPENFQN